MKKIVFLCVLGLLWAGQASAVQIAVSTSDTGWYDEDGYHNSSNILRNYTRIGGRA